MDFLNRVEIELKIVSTIIQEPKGVDLVIRRINYKYFRVSSIADVFKAIRFIADQNNEATETSIKTVMLNVFKLDSDYVTESIDNIVIHDAELENLNMYIDLLERDYHSDLLLELSERIGSMVAKEEDIVDIVKQIETSISVIDPVMKNNLVFDAKDAISEALYDINNTASNGNISYSTGDVLFDDLVGFYPGDMMLIGGKAGSFKTKYTIYLMNKILAKYSDISVLWYAMEDPAAKIIRGFLSQDLHLSDKELRNVGYKLNNKEKEKINELTSKIIQYDIRFVNKSAGIEEIGNDFKLFRKDRQDRFNILIIDNIMKLSDHRKFRSQIQSDDFISLTMDSWNIKTERGKNMVIFLHHFTDEQLDKVNINEGYRPREKHLKGSTRYRDIATEILLVNNPGNYPDLTSRFSDYQLLLKKLFLVDVTKNRNGDTGFLRYFALPEYNIFKLLKR